MFLYLNHLKLLVPFHGWSMGLFIIGVYHFGTLCMIENGSFIDDLWWCIYWKEWFPCLIAPKGIPISPHNSNVLVKYLVDDHAPFIADYSFFINYWTWISLILVFHYHATWLSKIKHPLIVDDYLQLSIGYHSWYQWEFKDPRVLHHTRPYYAETVPYIGLI